MSRNTDDMLSLDEPSPIRSHWPRTSRGPLHDMLTKALPDLVDQSSGVCNLQKLAEELEMSYQAIYKWFRPGKKNRIPAGRVNQIVEMSARQKSGGKKFVPAKREDFWNYLST